MSTAANRSTTPVKSQLAPPTLDNGDHMSQAEFHRRYQLHPDHSKFELIDGIVFMASSLSRTHAKFHATLSMVLRLYVAKTPGIELLDNATTILGNANEPQPDLSLRVLTEFGGQSKELPSMYVQGAPELVAEISHSSLGVDMHLKRHAYERASVLEYMVLSVEEPKLYWFNFAGNASIEPDRRGIASSRAFPGLWIHVDGLISQNDGELLNTLDRGLKSSGHRAFVKKLKARRQDGKKSDSEEKSR
jgi:hypothetical protein